MSTRGRYGALAGVAAAALALGLAELVAVATGPRSAPLIAVGGVVVDTVPQPVKQLAITVFGVHDKTALQVGTALLLTVFAALVGALATRSRWYGLGGVGVFGAVGIAAALTRAGAGPLAALPALLGASAAAVVLWFLLARLAGEQAPAPVAPPPVSGPGGDPGAPEAFDGPDRRRFLRLAGASLGAAALAGIAGRVLSTRRDVTVARAAVTLPPPATPAPPVPAGAELGVTDLTRYVTGNRDFYRIDTALVVPTVNPDEWQLRITGRVANPMTLTFAQLLARPMIERYVTLTCVSNEVGGDLVGNARWLGVPLKDLLDEAQPLDGADQVVGRSADGWTCGTPTAALRDGRDAMLAVGMNGVPLPIEHGFPVRMVVPGLYGYVSACKWVVELELTTFAAYDAYWVPRGWAQQAPIKTQSRIDSPRGRPRAGTVTVAGVAWAQHRGIAKVEVRVDDGPWHEATLADTVSADTWRQWFWRWDATPGRHRLTVRATDADGHTQPEREQPVDPDGATGWHSITVTVT